MLCDSSACKDLMFNIRKLLINGFNYGGIARLEGLKAKAKPNQLTVCMLLAISMQTGLRHC